MSIPIRRQSGILFINLRILGDDNSDDTSGLDLSSRDFLESAIQDYNQMFKTNYDTSGDKFQSYYKDVSERVKKRESVLEKINAFFNKFWDR